MPEQYLPKLDFNKISPDVNVQGQVYDAFYGTKGGPEFSRAIGALPISDEVKQSLHDMRLAHQAGRTINSPFIMADPGSTPAPPIAGSAPIQSKAIPPPVKPSTALEEVGGSMMHGLNNSFLATNKMIHGLTANIPSAVPGQQGANEFIEDNIRDLQDKSVKNAPQSLPGKVISGVTNAVASAPRMVLASKATGGNAMGAGALDTGLQSLDQGATAGIKSAIGGALTQAPFHFLSKYLDKIVSPSVQASVTSKLAPIISDAGAKLKSMVPQASNAAVASLGSMFQGQPIDQVIADAITAAATPKLPGMNSKNPNGPKPQKPQPKSDLKQQMPTPKRADESADVFARSGMIPSKSASDSAKVFAKEEPIPTAAPPTTVQASPQGKMFNKPQSKSKLPQQVPQPKSAAGSAAVVEASGKLPPIPSKSAAESAEVLKNAPPPTGPKLQNTLPTPKSAAESAEVLAKSPITAAESAGALEQGEPAPDYAKSKSELIPVGTRYKGSDGQIHEIDRHVKLDPNQEFYAEFSKPVKASAREMEDLNKTNHPTLDDLENKYKIGNPAPSVVPVAESPIPEPVAALAPESIKPPPAAEASLAPVEKPSPVESITPPTKTEDTVIEAVPPVAPLKPISPPIAAVKPAVEAPTVAPPAVKPKAAQAAAAAPKSTEPEVIDAPGAPNGIHIRKMGPEIMYGVANDGKETRYNAVWDGSNNSVTVKSPGGGTATVVSKSKDPKAILAAIKSGHEQAFGIRGGINQINPGPEESSSGGKSSRITLLPGDEKSNNFKFSVEGGGQHEAEFDKNSGRPTITVWDGDEPYVAFLKHGSTDPKAIRNAIDDVYGQMERKGVAANSVETPKEAGSAEVKPSAPIKPASESPVATQEPPIVKKRGRPSTKPAESDEASNDTIKINKHNETGKLTITAKNGYTLEPRRKVIKVKAPNGKGEWNYRLKGNKEIEEMSPKEILDMIESDKEDIF